jgi:hypothetical protein
LRFGFPRSEATGLCSEAAGLCSEHGELLGFCSGAAGLCGKEENMLTKKEQPTHWYEQSCWPYASAHQTVEQYATWLSVVPWQLICTLTFAWKINDQRADKVFAGFIDRLETVIKGNIAFVRGDEKRFSGCGKPACARHFHTLFASEKPLDPSVVEVLWKSMAGNRSDDAGAQVKPYDPAQNGASYILKSINSQYGDWAFRKLYLFHPEARSLQTMNKRLRRNLRRQHARALVNAELVKVGAPVAYTS